MKNLYYLFAMLLSLILTLLLYFMLKKGKKNQLKTAFSVLLMLMFIWTLSLILQILFQNTNIPPVFFEGLASFGAEFVSLAFLALSIIFSRSKISICRIHLVFIIIPILSIILMLTNSYHHLYYINYSTSLNETLTGPYMLVHSLYSYILLGIGIIIFMKYTIKHW